MKCVKKIMLGVLMVAAIGVVITACGNKKNTTDNTNKTNTENTTNNGNENTDTKDIKNENTNPADGTGGTVTDSIGEGMENMGENIENMGNSGTTAPSPAGTDGNTETTPVP